MAKQLLESVRSDDFRGMIPLPVWQERQVGNAAYRARLQRFAETYREYVLGQGHAHLRAKAQLRETMGTDDFAYLFGDTLQRLLLDQFAVANHDWELYAGLQIAPDFRDVKRYRVTSGAGLLDEVA